MEKRVLHIARYCGPRVYKQVLCQQGAGWDVTLMAGVTGHPELHAMVDKQAGWCNVNALASITRCFDVVVIHTTVSTNNDKYLPIDCARTVWDCHDYVDRELYDTFDAVVCPSKGMAKCFENGHVVYSKVPRSLVPKPTHSTRVDACVLAATIGNGEAWSNYEGVSERIGMPVFIMPSGDNYVGHRDELIMRRLPYCDMLSAMTKFRCGYAGSANDDVSIHNCVTNKFWEYQVAGCRVLLRNASEMEELYMHTQCGVPVMEDELDKMKEAYDV